MQSPSQGLSCDRAYALYPQSYKRQISQFSTYIFSADDTWNAETLQGNEVKVFFLVLVYIFNLS